jgi:hypothetical protein
MGLLLESNIETLVKVNIRGRVARAGGSVDQLIHSKQCRVEDINIPDGGFGKIWRASRHEFLPALRRQIKQEVKFLFYGHRISRDRKTVILDMHDAHKHPELHAKYDCAVSSNLIEHSPNPIWLLLNFYFITKADGWQFHAIPHYKYTYDRFRVPTPLDHFIENFEKQTGTSDTIHTEDYRHSAVIKDGWQKRFHEKYPLEYPFIHFHVFDEHNTRALLEYVFRDVVTDVYKTERFSDNVVLCRNALNPQFAAKHERLLRNLAT